MPSSRMLKMVPRPTPNLQASGRGKPCREAAAGTASVDSQTRQYSPVHQPCGCSATRARGGQRSAFNQPRVQLPPCHSHRVEAEAAKHGHAKAPATKDGRRRVIVVGHGRGGGAASGGGKGTGVAGSVALLQKCRLEEGGCGRRAGGKRGTCVSRLESCAAQAELRGEMRGQRWVLTEAALGLIGAAGQASGLTETAAARGWGAAMG